MKLVSKPYCYLLYMLFIFVSNSMSIYANDTISKTNAIVKKDSTSIRLRPADQKIIERILSDEDYVYDRVGPAPKTPWERFKEWFWHMVDELFDSKGGQVGLSIFQYALIIAAIVLIIVLLVKTDIRSVFYGKSASVAIDFKELDEDIHKINFEELIAKAIANKDYRKAVRLHFLKLLKELTDKNLIKWQIDKTNHDYSIELAKSKYSTQFQELSLLYEYIWYGDFEINESNFKNTISKFNSFKV